MSRRRPKLATPREEGLASSPWRAALIAALVALAVYLPSVGGGFLYDDARVVVENRHIRDLGRLGTVLAFEPSRPLLNLTWALNYAVGGVTPWHYHLVNVLIHAANAALLASLLGWVSVRLGGRQAWGAATLGACLFAATPMAAETVAYVASRSTALVTLFMLATLRLAVSALETGSRRRLGAALGLFLLALATKEAAAALPLLLLLLDLYGIARGRARDVVSRLAWHLPFLSLVVLGLAGRRVVTGAWLPAPVVDRTQYLITQVAAFPGYLLRALVPLDPAFYRQAPLSPWPPDAATLIGLVLSGGLVAGALAYRRRWPDWSLAVLWMAAALAPSSSIVPLQEMVVDHRAYLGGAGICLALARLIWRPGRLLVAAAIVAVLGAGALRYEWILGDPVRAWQDAARRAPRAPKVHVALADAHAARGEVREAERAFAEALRLDPGNAYAATNLGAYYVGQGRYREAAAAWRVAARGAPRDARVRDNLGMILQHLGLETEALAEFEAAVAGEPRLAQPRINLAALLIRRGARARAEALLEEAASLEIDAQDARAIEMLRAQLR